MRFLSLVAAFIILYTPILNAQDFTFDGDKMTVVFEASLDKKKLHSAVFAAVANIYNSANDVVQMSDAEAGKIIVKGTSKVTLEDPSKLTDPKNDFILKYQEYFVEHSINIDIKDDKYRIEFLVGEKHLFFMGNKYVHNKIAVPWLTFASPSETETQDYVENLKNAFAENRLTKGLLKKKKYIAYFDAIPSIWKENVEAIRQMSRNIALRINSSIVNEGNQDDNW